MKGKEEDECVHLDKVTWLEADGSYTKFHSIGGKTQILTANLDSTLRQLEASGDSKVFELDGSKKDIVVTADKKIQVKIVA